MYDRAFSRLVNDHVHGVADLPLPSEHRIRLLTAMGDADSYGTEVATGGGYVSGSGAPLVEWAEATDATPAVSANNGDVMVTSYPRAETIVGVEIWALVASTPTRLEYGELDDPVTTIIGDILILSAEAIASALS